ncbi:MarR family winged helix-turn-helix transcriptional regulator [Pararhodobacter oceanensis]|uniref:MarR family winged helix-turn-helix transcriptional regulator n=1 Tax=Pararhodobacter oceanensis TaxID=2172121 RepID=UPI003A9069DC
MAGADSTLRRFIGYDMKRAFNLIQGDVNAALKPFGLRMVTFSALCVIRDTPGLKQSRLAQILMIERPNLVLILDDLERAELVVRERCAEDRRAFELTVTALGAQVCNQAVAAVERHDARMTSGLEGAEVQALHKALRQIELNGRSVNDPSDRSTGPVSPP